MGDKEETRFIGGLRRSSWLRVLGVLALGAMAGIVASLLANAFVAAVIWANDALLISPRSRMMAGDTLLLALATVLVPTAGGLVVGLLHRGIAEGRAHGPAEIIAAVQTRRGALPRRAGLLSSLSAMVSLGSGASVGQYGPLVHMGGSVGSALARAFRAGVTSDNIAVASGVAAAISTAFNAPIAGILFAHEVILRHFALRAFAPVAVASILGYVVANAVLPQPPLFQIAEAKILHLWEFGSFVLLGALAALLAMLYMRAILGVGQVAQHLRLPPMLKPALAGAGIGLAALWMPDILGIGGETLRLAFIEGAYGHAELLVVMALKLVATALCLGMGFSGGVFSPSLVIGSLFGAFFGNCVAWATGGDASALVVYAICGMVAVAAPVIGAPLTAIVIVMELTGSYELTLAALAAVALANLVVSRSFGRSFFDRQLRDRGLDLSGGRSRALLASRSIRDVMGSAPVTVAPESSVAMARAAMAAAGSSDAYLLDTAGRYQGTLLLQTLLRAPDDAPATEWHDAAHAVMTPETSLWEAMELLRDFVGESVPVIDGEGRLLGIVVESDLIRAYLDLLEALREEEHAAA